MMSEEMRLFRQALWEASCNVYERELAACTEDARCSRRHYAKMRKILGVVVLPATSQKRKIRRRVVTALIAAALLLTGCTAYAYRKEIREFIETIFDDHIEVKYNERKEKPTEATITEYYTLGYVPEGYERGNSNEFPAKTKEEWRNSAGEYIVFEQYHVESSLFGMDEVIETWTTIQIGNSMVYYRFSGAHCYVWNDDEYAYQITTSMQLEEHVLSNMIKEIRARE